MTVEGLRTTINKQFIHIFVFCVPIYTDFHFSEKRIFKKTIWQHWPKGVKSHLSMIILTSCLWFAKKKKNWSVTLLSFSYTLVYII